MSKIITQRKSKKRRSTYKSSLKRQTNKNKNNNSFFEENENNLYEFMRFNNFEEFEYDDEEYFSEGGRSSGRFSPSRSRFSRSKKSQTLRAINPSLIQSKLSIGKTKNYFNNSKKLDSEFILNSSGRKSKKSFDLHLNSYLKNEIYDEKGFLMKLKKRHPQGEAEIKMKLNQEIKNDKYFLDYKSPRFLRNSLEEKINEQKYSNSEFNSSEKEDFEKSLNDKTNLGKRKKKTINNDIMIDNIEEIKDQNIIENVKKFNKKNAEFKEIKQKNLQKKASNYDFIKMNKSRFSNQGSVNSSRSISKKDKKYFDYFNNFFQEDKIIKTIKKKKDLKIYDFELKNFNNISNRESIWDNNILNNPSFYENIQLNKNYYNESLEKKANGELNRKTLKFNYNDLSLIERNNISLQNIDPQIFLSEKFKNEFIYDKLPKFKYKWNKEEREKKIKPFENKNSKFFNNVILLRPEILQSQKQTQFDIFNNKFYRKNNLDYVNYILKKAKKKEEIKQIQTNEVDKKVERFSKKMEDMENSRLKNFIKLKEISNIHSKFNKKEDYHEDYFKTEENQLISNRNNLATGNQDSNYFEIQRKSDLTNQKTKISSNSINNIEGSNLEKFKNQKTFETKKTNCCQYLMKIFDNIKGFLINDPNKIFAEKKITWVGKLGRFPKEFVDNRKIN